MNKSYLLLSVILTLTFSVTSQAEVISFGVDKYETVENFSYKFQAFEKYRDFMAIIDCQSFVQGFHLYSYEGERWQRYLSINLYPSECAELHHFIKTGLKDKKFPCLKIDDVATSISLTNSKSCQ